MKTFAECQKCGALNKVVSEKATEKKPVCGKCQGPLKLHGMVAEVNSKNFQYIIKNAQGPVVVDFWASWCGPCQYYAPEFEKASIETSQKNQEVIFLKINTEIEQELSQHFNIRGIPCTIVFQNGQEIRRQSGAMSSDQVQSLIKA